MRKILQRKKRKSLRSEFCIIVLLLLMVLQSCSQLFNTLDKNISSDTIDSLNTTCKLSVSLLDVENCSDLFSTSQINTNISKIRSVFPTFPTSYKAKIWELSDTEPTSWENPYSDLSFTISSSLAATYYVELGFFEDDTLEFYADPVTVSVEAGQTSASCTVSILPDDCTAADGSDDGDISLSLTESVDEIDSLSVKLLDSSSEEVSGVSWNAGTNTIATSSSITKGKYTLKVYGLDESENIIYIYDPETLYVWPGLTTDLWYSSDGETTSTREITQSMYDESVASTFFVSGTNGCLDTGDDDTGDGGYSSPFATISTAVDNCSSSTDCTIYIDGTVSASETVTIDCNKNITIISLSSADTDSVSGDNFVVDSGSTVTIENLIFSDGSSDDNGGCISNAGILTLKDCTIENCTATENGGALYNTGTLTLTSCIITGCTATESGGALYIDSSDTTEMTDGVIESNTAGSYGDGVYVSSGCLFSVSGTAVIDTSTDSVYLAGDSGSNGTIVIADTLDPSCNSTVSSDLTALIVTSDTASSYASTIGDTVLTLNTSGSWEECNYFALAESEPADDVYTQTNLYVVKPDETSGIIAKAGVSVTTTYNSLDAYTLEATKSDYPAGVENTVNLSVIDSDSESVTPDSVSLTLYQSGESTGITDTETSLTLPSYLPAGTYQLYMTAVVNDNSYCEWEDIIIHESIVATTADEVQDALDDSDTEYIVLENDMELSSTLTVSTSLVYILPNPGETITLSRASSYTGALITTTVNNLYLGDSDGNGEIVLDGGAGDDLSSPTVTASAPLVSETNGTVYMYYVTMQNNYNEGSEVHGGAIYNKTYHYMDLHNCTIKNCYSSYGGGICVECRVNLYDTSISDCSAVQGGALYYSSDRTNAIYAGCSITENTATSYGGGIYYASGYNFYIYNDVIISENTVGTTSSQIYDASGTIYIYTDSDNTAYDSYTSSDGTISDAIGE